MKVTVFGLGHVGLVQAAVLAEVGHDVLCIDIDNRKVEDIKKGIIPFYEFGLESLLQKNYNIGRLKFTLDPKTAVEHGLIQLIAVNTPANKDGSIDLSQIFSVIHTIAQYINEYKIVLEKSTVPVGTTGYLRHIINKELKYRGSDIPFDIVFNPEFLMEGSAIFNCMYPDRIIVGIDDCNDSKVTDILYELYAPFDCKKHSLVFMDVNSAELSKYAANCILATKISFINEISNLAEIFGADIEKIRQGMVLDQRIGSFFLYPGCGYGGSCFSKDIRALVYYSKKFGYIPKLLSKVEEVNKWQKNKLLIFIKNYFGKDLSNKIFALWGLSFKPNTDDISCASSRVLIESLLRENAKIQAYDPRAMDVMRNFYGVQDGLYFFDTKEDVLYNSDALVICTEWEDFLKPDFDLIKAMLKNPVIFDGRNLYDPNFLYSKGFIYYAIGRGASCFPIEFGKMNEIFSNR